MAAAPLTSFYVIAEITCPKCLGTCRDSQQRRAGEPDYCDECTGHGMQARRVDLKTALADLGVIIPDSTAAIQEANDGN
jgi:hypothetical protein